MPEAITKSIDGADYERCLIELKDKGDARYGICMDAYKQHHEKDPETGGWVRKKGHTKNEKGEWIVKNFKGFDDWIEVFRTGTHTDSAGNTKDWKEDDLKKISKNYNPEKNEAPIVIGHPDDNAPAYGWIEKTKTEGGILWAKFKDVIPEFADMVKKGMFKKRSISLSPGLDLRHIGFLGATPPAVKGLADLKFNKNEETTTFEFEEKQHKSVKAKKEEKTMKFMDFVEIFKFWKKLEKDPDADFGIPGGGDDQKSFTEADIEAAKKTGAEAERKKAETEFTEKERQAKGEAHTKEISDFCDTLVKDGKIPPSWVDLGLVEFAKCLDSETEISFSEKGEKKSPGTWFKNFLEGLEKSKIFQELATKEKTGQSADFAEAKKDQETGESIAAKVNPAKE